MKKIWIFLILLSTGFAASAQVELLPSPSEQEKAELRKLTDSYLTFVNKMSVPGDPEGKKASTIKFMKEVLAKGDVFTINDIDTTGKTENIKFLVYMNRLAPFKGGTLKHSIDKASVTYEKMRYDQWRRFYYAEIKATKKLSWIETKKVADSLQRDTVTKEVSVSIFVKFEKENGLSKNFRLWSITEPGKMPALPPLEPLQKWWLGLDDEWKTLLNKTRKMDAYPRESDLERLTYQSELNFEKAVFKTYEPLSAFTNVRKLIISESNINSFEPISKMKSLTYLDISKSQIKNIKGVEKLTKLEEFYCVGNQLTSIASVATVVSLVKFNCAENDLDSIDAVKELVNLKELNISLNIKVKNIDAVRNLVNMEKLSFRKIEIKDLTPVQQMKNLVYLDCFNTGITSLEPIRNLQKIFHLDLSNNKVTTLDPIRNYRYVVNLYLNYSSVSDLSVVDNFYLLRELQISGCPQITTLGGVHKLENLVVLKCYYTKIGKDEIQRFKKNHPNCAITYY
ncbi:MAG TPA: leucine-rich repeat domain-containing protein [Cytophagaceae bacterium]|nr:leucine-rich repeat domain-containing protein [Cytophagaceae bacterium]